MLNSQISEYYTLPTKGREYPIPYSSPAFHSVRTPLHLRVVRVGLPAPGKGGGLQMFECDRQATGEMLFSIGR